MIREIVVIDEELCDGCGICIPACHEGALQIIDGKARLVSELMCDGLGACIGYCPQDAISIEMREAEKYDETAVISRMVQQGKNIVLAHLKHLQEHNETGYLQEALDYLKTNRENLPFSIQEVHNLLFKGKNQNSKGCPGSAPISFGAAGFQMAQPEKEQESALTHWPVQLHLINPEASLFQGADLLIAADCAAFAHGDFHRKYIAGKKVVIACPKLDHNQEIYLRKFITLIDEAKVNTITVAIMEVPCCGGLMRLIQAAISQSVRNVPLKVVVFSIRGEVLSEEWVF